ncbi:MAG: hypothetical protein IAG13_05810, partial [Deltaproteobacteria bacterium]|nr:hypothetical protein [Nannocystaceae bacterium]
DKSVRMWPLQPAEMIAAACVRLGQGLTEQQWSEHIGGEPSDPCARGR